jgi:hypothetical protein
LKRYEVFSFLLDEEDNVVFSKTVMRRYSDFATFHTSLVDRNPSKQDVYFPPKYMKLLTDHLEIDFIERRRSQLQVFLQAAIKVPEILMSRELTRFLDIPQRS